MRSGRRSFTSYEVYDRIVIVGAGPGGIAAAEELRRLGHRGGIVLMCDEPEAPYDRPACSKGLLTGHQRPIDTRLPIAKGTEVTWAIGQRAVCVDPDARIVSTDTGEIYAYDGLVIASGSRAVVPEGWPVGEPGLYSLYKIEEAWALRQDLRTARKVVVVGAGIAGCEVACAVRGLARDVVIVDRNPQVMTRALGEVVGGMVTEEIKHEGVQLRLGRHVSQVSRRRGGWQVVLDDGEQIQADIVVVTLGERPNSEWLAETAGIDISDGVLCDASLRVVGADGMVAAGTVARWPNLRYSAEPIRCGQWIIALEQGRAAAQALLAADRSLPPVTPVPRFWSSQFGLRIQVCGELPSDAEVAVTCLRPGRRDAARSGVMASYLRDGQIVGLVAVNAMHAFVAVSRSILGAPVQIVEPAPVAPPIAAPPFAPETPVAAQDELVGRRARRFAAT